MNKAGIGSHTKTRQGETNTWLTPRFIIDALGPFHLDPCAAPSPRPWDTAQIHYELPTDGLAEPWSGPWCSRCGPALPGDGSPGSVCSSCGETILVQPQRYRCWVNPPYGPETGAWLDKLSRHGSGTALIFARTETEAWHSFVWPHAHSIFFFNQRLWFHHADGTRGKSNAGGPSALISYSYLDTCAIQHAWKNCQLKGVLVRDWAGRKWAQP